MKIIVRIFFLVFLSQLAAASILSDLSSAITTLKDGFGRLLTDVVEDVKVTIDCTIFTMEHMLRLKANELEYQKKCKSNKNIPKIDDHKHQPEAVLTELHKATEDIIAAQDEFVEKTEKKLDSSLSKVEEDLCKNLEKKLGHSYGQFGNIKQILKKKTDRLNDINAVLKTSLDKLSSDMNTKYGDDDNTSQPTVDKVYNNLLNLQHAKVNSDNENNTEGIDHIFDKVVDIIKSDDSIQDDNEIAADKQNSSNSVSMYINNGSSYINETKTNNTYYPLMKKTEIKAEDNVNETQRESDDSKNIFISHKKLDAQPLSLGKLKSTDSIIKTEIKNIEKEVVSQFENDRDTLLKTFKIGTKTDDENQILNASKNKKHKTPKVNMQAKQKQFNTGKENASLQDADDAIEPSSTLQARNNKHDRNITINSTKDVASKIRGPIILPTSKGNETLHSILKTNSAAKLQSIPNSISQLPPEFAKFFNIEAESPESRKKLLKETNKMKKKRKEAEVVMNYVLNDPANKRKNIFEYFT